MENNEVLIHSEEVQLRPGVVKKFLKNRLAVLGFVIVVLVVLTAIFAPIIATHDPNAINASESFLSAGEKGHLLGTDNFGRDLFSRIIYGSRISIIVSISSILLGGVLGVILGLVAGYFGGIIDASLMRIMDGFSAFPFILLAILLMTVLGQGLPNVILAIGVGNIPGFARIIRSQVLNVKEEEFIEVEHSLGASNTRIIFHHILPNCIPSLIVYGTINVAGAIISEATLSFLGLGIQPPTASWGSILRDGKSFLAVSPGIATFSGIAILLTVLGINMLGDGLRDALDPKSVE